MPNLVAQLQNQDRKEAPKVVQNIWQETPYGQKIPTA
jgi:hypothetical protein